MILAVRTDKLEAELYVYKHANCVASYTWEAHRQLADTIHTKIHTILVNNDADWSSLQGLIVYKGPGSFTGLRIGVTVVNTLGYSLNIPIAGTTGENWLTEGLVALQKVKQYTPVLPDYGGHIHITQPKK
ncbi:MAG TPA: tRNA (adenosine(37)-N6)-threonylcarbamoyltransferase complex dimerization subunit type 1 TsaB [Candidatus Saccharibacteria bacterium]|nr:tRNA (adenosine(37)-N6)-threonylcarbamoyltransferase complex dimerization subunit type 1 TsaB [Candidatus Nomurabacteria bacterium]HPD99058.1 tRNA (adenosine(37)-N6)-threonylcarbamoyltransferase complex dimerization subunit type 1 TsaB [Candidatus Saccharibacteria bacterium]